MMAHHAEEKDGPEAVSMTSVQQEQKCPMTCCMQAGSRTARPAPLAVSFTPFLFSESFREFESQIFTATGFSSHTDRGPPLLQTIA
jgi:hypothetical protein